MRRYLIPATLVGLMVAGCGDDTSGTGGSGGEGGNTTTTTTTGSMTTTTTTTTTGMMDVCGDGVVSGSETCDDGDTTGGDGCDSMCAIESGYVCAGEPSNCVPDCGDGVVVGAEACDDGNAVALDGCDTMCAVESGYTCAGMPSACTATCGDGVIAAGAETCDDGNVDATDGCTDVCAITVGYACAGEPSVCMTNCGDGVVAGVETCDDGANVDGDGCDMACAVEAGFTCAGDPSVCTTTCGDGIVAGMETCDDSNTTGGDCCSSTCDVEAGCETEPNNTDLTADDFATHQQAGLVYGFVDPSGDLNYYSVVLAQDGSITAETFDGILGTTCVSNSVDTRIQIFDSLGAVITSNDDGGAGFCSLASTGLLTAGTYYIAIDASPFDPTATFDYALSVTVNAVVCGDGDLDPGETCDDGNTNNNDGCSSTCQVECNNEVDPNDLFSNATALNVPGNLNCGAINPIADVDFWSFTVGAVSDVSIETFDGTGAACPANHDTLIQLIGSDGTTVLASDDDDGIGACSFINAAADAGARTLQPGTYYVRINEFGDNGAIVDYRVGVTFTATCGNGTVEGSEECDGGAAPCDANCQRVPVCGDSFIDAPETCDDGNTTNGDGCSSVCQAENGESEPNNSFAEADTNAVQFTGNASVAAAIGVVGDQDTFRLVLAAPQAVRIETFGPTVGDCPTGLTTTTRIFDSTQTQLYLDTTTGIRSCSALVVNLAAGTYYVRVEESGNNAIIAAYNLEIALLGNTGNEVEPNDTFATASTNFGGATNQFVFGDHQIVTDDDWFSITVPAGASIRAETIEGGGETCESNGIDSRLTLFGTDGTTVLVDDDDDGRGFCSQIDGTGVAPAKDPAANNLAAGTYYLLVRRSGTLTGASAQFDYRLAVTVRTP